MRLKSALAFFPLSTLLDGRLAGDGLLEAAAEPAALAGRLAGDGTADAAAEPAVLRAVVLRGGGGGVVVVLVALRWPLPGVCSSSDEFTSTDTGLEQTSSAKWTVADDTVAGRFLVVFGSGRGGWLY
jgi:hypothetical protein